MVNVARKCIAELEKVVSQENIRYDEPMKNHTTIKIGGPADIMVTPSTEKEIIEILKIAKKYNIHIMAIGNGSKLLVTDKGIRGIVLKISSRFSYYEIDGEYITALAGMSMPKISRIAMKEGLSGLEFACGIPGNLGGGVRMNAGAYGSELSNVLYETTYIDENLDIKTISNEEHNFKYRYSYFKDNPKHVIVKVKLKLSKGNVDDIKTKMDDNSASRKEKQPLEYPNAGSTFKRPEGIFVGTVIQELGLKGYRIGDAQISEKHAGFIVNLGNATAQNVIDLMDYIRGKVLEKYGVLLENEIEIIGEK